MTDVFSQFKSILFLNGNFGPEIANRKLPTAIAADGAAWKMHSIGIMPDIIIGDLDSLKSDNKWREKFASSEVIELSEQETNDFDKALTLIESRKLSPCMIVGMQGGDLEHSLNNWSILIKFCGKIKLAVLEVDRLALPLLAGQKMTIRCDLSSIVSLIPQPECQLTTKGLAWELESEVLKLGIREGARNRTVEGDFSVLVESGSLLMFIPAASKIA